MLRCVLKEGLYSIVQFDNTEQAIKAATSQWVSLVLINLVKINKTSYSYVQHALPIISEIYEQIDLRALHRMIEDRLLYLLDQIGMNCKDTVIKRILDFVERHYSENLKLKTLGDLFHYNSGYLGRLFKSVTGDTFRTYLDKVRIRKAKVLLESGLKVHEAATRVGISNVNYFHVKFNKYMGVAPSLYKARTYKRRGNSAL
ncbi:helix-turn-helix domain-containing protein [Paenibacillus sp. Soil522]|uniref:helix-turn-helix domain-containing protein n=1 Tax=Paenibacillus sp. Soil522 TaxID=1736388 RepID=UPI0006F5DCEA|nr:helix-turn-helix domain-containing protein [Paenibacillus sp. Soil522]KRE45376.1 hypothetical protein ASG81_13245 [Paenibacillus sp. Soil522]